MKTQLFDTSFDPPKPVSGLLEGGHKVDGVRSDPAPWVEYEVIDVPQPEAGPNEQITGRTRVFNHDAKTLTLGWTIAPYAHVRRQQSDIVLQRLTEAERTALFTARQQSPAIDYFITRATAVGFISEEDADFAAGVSALDGAGIIAAARWAELLAP